MSLSAASGDCSGTRPSAPAHVAFHVYKRVGVLIASFRSSIAHPHLFPCLRFAVHLAVPNARLGAEWIANPSSEEFCILCFMPVYPGALIIPVCDNYPRHVPRTYPRNVADSRDRRGFSLTILRLGV